MKNKKNFIFNMVFTAILAALVVVLQVFASGLKLGTVTFSFVMIPIALGACLVNEYAGLFLGFVFGLVTLIAGVTGSDTFTFILFNAAPLRTAGICLIKGMAAGFVPGLVNRLLSKNKLPLYPKTVISSALAPICNTGLFVVLALSLSDILQENFIQGGSTTLYFLIFACAGINFLVEFLTTVALTPAIAVAIKRYKR